MLPISLQHLKENISAIVLGKEDSLTLLLVGLLAEGHILGILGKTRGH